MYEQTTHRVVRVNNIPTPMKEGQSICIKTT